MWRWFLLHYTDKKIIYSWLVWYWKQYNIEWKKRIKKKIRSIQHWLHWYYSKHYKDKIYYWEQAEECFRQLQEELHLINKLK